MPSCINFLGRETTTAALSPPSTKSAAWRRLRAAGDRDYIVNEETRKGRPGRWVIGEPLSEDVPILPDPEVLQPDNPGATPEPLQPQGEPDSGCTVARSSEGRETTPTPSPPSDDEPDYEVF